MILEANSTSYDGVRDAMMFDTVNSATEVMSSDLRLKRRVVKESGIAVRTTVAAQTETKKPICDVLTSRSADIDGSMPVGRNSDVTVANTVKPMAVIAAQGNRSVDGAALLTGSTLSPDGDAFESSAASVDRSQRPENGDEVDEFL